MYEITYKKLYKIKVITVNDHLYRETNYECSHVKVCIYPKQVRIQIKLADNGQPYVRTTKMMNITIDIKKKLHV